MGRKMCHPHIVLPRWRLWIGLPKRSSSTGMVRVRARGCARRNEQPAIARPLLFARSWHRLMNRHSFITAALRHDCFSVRLATTICGCPAAAIGHSRQHWMNVASLSKRTILFHFSLEIFDRYANGKCLYIIFGSLFTNVDLLCIYCKFLV